MSVYKSVHGKTEDLTGLGQIGVATVAISPTIMSAYSYFGAAYYLIIEYSIFLSIIIIKKISNTLGVL